MSKDIDNFVKVFLASFQMAQRAGRDRRRDAQAKEMMALRQRLTEAQIANINAKTEDMKPMSPERLKQFAEIRRAYGLGESVGGGQGGVYGAPRGSGRIHAGIDIPGANGSPATALGEGKVVYVGQHSGYGNTIDVLNKDGNVARYALHEGRIGVKPGDQVREGQQIGTVGGRHVHHEIIKKDTDAWRASVGGQFGQTSRQGGRSDQTIDPREYYGSRLPSGASNAATGDPNAAKGSLKSFGALSPDPTKVTAPPSDAGGDDISALPLKQEEGSDTFGSGSSGDDWSDMPQREERPDEKQALPISGDDWSETENFAEGGMVGASSNEPFQAALHDVQNSYELGREDAALPGTDTARAQRMQALQKGEGAISPDAFNALVQAVDPEGKSADPVGDAMEQIYGFYASKGDKAGAAKAASSVMQAARMSSMQKARAAGEALDQKNYRAAGQALIEAYKDVPDGLSVTGEVNEQGMGRIMLSDAKTGKPVEEIDLNPQMLAEATSKLMAGDGFFELMAERAGGSQPKGERALAMAEGGLVDDDDDDDDPDDGIAMDFPEDAGDDGALPLSAAEGSDEFGGAEASGSDQGAVPMSGAKGALQAPAPPPLLPVAGSSADRAMIQQMNREMQMIYQQRVREYNAAITNERVLARQREARQFREQQSQTRAQQQQAIAMQREAMRTHAARMKDDPDYRRKFELGQLDERGRDLDRQQGALESAAFADMYSPTGVSPEYGRVERNRNELQGEQLNVTARSAKGGDPDRTKLGEALQAFVSSGKPKKPGGKVDEPDALKPYDMLRATNPDGKPNANYDEDAARRFLDVAEAVGRTNQIGNDTLVRAVVDMTMNKAVHPKIVRDVNGVRVQVGNERLFMDNDTFRRMAMFRAENIQLAEQAQAKKVEETKQGQIKASVKRADDDPWALPLDWNPRDKVGGVSVVSMPMPPVRSFRPAARPE